MESQQKAHRKESGTTLVAMEPEENTLSEAEILHSQIFNALDSMWLSSPQLSANKEPILSNITALNSDTLMTILTKNF